MAWIYTQQELIDKIKAIDEDIATARKSQEYSYDEGPIGQFGVKKGKIDDMLKERQSIIDELKLYYPDAFKTQPQIEFNEIGFING
jgi:hypothetical protein